MRHTRWISIGALLISVFGVLMGNGVMTTLVPVRAALEGFARTEIGYMGASYFLGMLLGAMAAPYAVRRLGSIPTFALTSVIGMGVLVAMPALVHPWSWVILRGVTGFSLAGIYAVVESYVQASAENRYRGRLLAAYSIMQYGGWSAGGQLMRVDDPGSTTIFFVAAAIIFVVGLLPLLLVAREPSRAGTGTEPPRKAGLDLVGLYRLSPIGFVVTILIGLANGPFWALTPVYATDIGLSAIAAGTLMTLCTIGAALFQFPVGRLSDAIDRRLVIVGLTLGSAVIEILLFEGRIAGSQPVLLGLGLLLGGLIATQYYTTSAHTNDRAGAGRAVNVSAALLFLYSIGAITGPLTASIAMEILGPAALFLHNAAVHIAVAVFVLLRILRRPPPPRVAAALPSSAPEG